MLVLNADDDSDDRGFFSDAINVIDPSISCVLFDSGQKLLDFLTTTVNLPDYIFIDINMPLMSGLECAQKIKSNNVFNNIKIIIYSTAFNPDDIAPFSNLGIKFLTKHNTFTDLVTSIKDIIKQ